MSSPWDEENLPDIAGLLQQQQEQTTTANVGPIATPFGKPLRHQSPAPVIPPAASKTYDCVDDIDDDEFQDVYSYLKGNW